MRGAFAVFGKYMPAAGNAKVWMPALDADRPRLYSTPLEIWKGDPHGEATPPT